MPELPEVETVRRGLEPVLTGARIEAVTQARADLRWPFPENLAGKLVGRRILGLGRRAKYLLIALDDGHSLVSHLGMSGSWRTRDVAQTDSPDLPTDQPIGAEARHHPVGKLQAHDHLTLHLSRGRERTAAIYNDPRRFGFVLHAPTAQLDDLPFFAGLGVEPTGNGLSGAYLAARLAGRKMPLKAALLDQRIIAGLGNIYVCEALWRASLSPRRLSHTIAMTASGAVPARTERLARAIADVIVEAIAAGGSSLRDYIHSDGSLGYFQHRFDVYDREGEPCRRADCGDTVSRIVQSGRSTFLCTRCQR